MARLEHTPSECVECFVHHAADPIAKPGPTGWRIVVRPVRIPEIRDRAKTDVLEVVRKQVEPTTLSVLLVEIREDPPGIQRVVVERPHRWG